MTSCGSVRSIKNRRNGFVHAGPSSVVGTVVSGVLVQVSSDGLAAATCAGSVESSSSVAASGAAVFIFDGSLADAFEEDARWYWSSVQADVC